MQQQRMILHTSMVTSTVMPRSHNDIKEKRNILSSWSRKRYSHIWNEKMTLEKILPPPLLPVHNVHINHWCWYVTIDYYFIWDIMRWWNDALKIDYAIVDERWYYSKSWCCKNGKLRVMKNVQMRMKRKNSGIITII